MCILISQYDQHTVAATTSYTAASNIIFYIPKHHLQNKTGCSKSYVHIAYSYTMTTNWYNKTFIYRKWLFINMGSLTSWCAAAMWLLMVISDDQAASQTDILSNTITGLNPRYGAKYPSNLGQMWCLCGSYVCASFYNKQPYNQFLIGLGNSDYLHMLSLSVSLSYFWTTCYCA